MKVAIFVDLGFWLKRLKYVQPELKDKFDCDPADNAEKVATQLFDNCIFHLKMHSSGKKRGKGNNSSYDEDYLYRIFIYDCPPISKKVLTPIRKEHFNFAETRQYRQRTELHKALAKKRKVALRLGHLGYDHGWKLKASVVEKLLKQQITVDSLTDNDFKYDIKQVGVDMMLGTDIASVSFNKFAERIILISGDSDFVPAAKLARRSGVDFILDSMHQTIRDELSLHIDGHRSSSKNPQNK